MPPVDVADLTDRPLSDLERRPTPPCRPRRSGRPWTATGSTARRRSRRRPRQQQEAGQEQEPTQHGSAGAGRSRRPRTRPPVRPSSGTAGGCPSASVRAAAVLSARAGGRLLRALEPLAERRVSQDRVVAVVLAAGEEPGVLDEQPGQEERASGRAGPRRDHEVVVLAGRRRSGCSPSSCRCPGRPTSGPCRSRGPCRTWSMPMWLSVVWFWWEVSKSLRRVAARRAAAPAPRTAWCPCASCRRSSCGRCGWRCRRRSGRRCRPGVGITGQTAPCM